ncbi:DUF2326 domain-containing protein [Salmonella enterica subsp. enterica serovar Ealing]|uniref:DUF2326 domain-containing protein n=1 Tax=Salmonella enterica TaxID=28901 RepID=A0A3W8ME20_SALER|nr:DUF2326 domain-containing protein [Salmonella enterica]EBP4031586.1 DUF2326 domain-containing protein [Salmonella enterica subsp. enterica]EBU9826287.1 DUF2326 domain-containing protein [Salmonella enterica subsp. enterica serovar Adelaide]EAA4002582.1 DUF2326 domain-containing protein [Salmonella enterica subsp. enterica serovar Ealing]EAB2173532.1 DUF2326 domain-containing protein [Salmonella enterica]EAB3339120.1 DUF2326 domain-containing protein [Salmonella enterica]
MKLLRFLLEIDGKKIREIPFFDNLNIITSKKNSDASGNSVGKSTLGRILDYLFDGSIKPIYIDEEFQTPKQEIEQLLTKSEVYVSLEYLGLDNQYNIIKRRLSTNVDLQDYILNGEEVTSKEYNAHIMGSIFNVYSAKPTLRKLAPKFFRTTQHRMTKTVNFDNGRNVSRSDISTVFLYLFNFNDTEILTKVHKLKTTIKGYERNLKAFNSVISQDKIVSSITSIRREIAKLERSLLSSEKGIDKLEIVSKINAIDDEQNTLSDEILSLDLKIKNIIETKKILSNNKQVYLLSELQSIYEYASVKIESTLEDYRQALSFHNHLLSTKLEFVSHGLINLQEEHEKATVRFAQLNNQKHSLFDELKSKKKIEEISDAMKEIGKLDKELAKLTAIIDKKDDIDSRLFSERKNLTELSGELEAELTNVASFEQKFIDNFKKYTHDFYGVEYKFSLHLDQEKGECIPHVDDVESNNEGGLKRLEVVTFDLAYIKTVCDKKALRPNFVLHDSIDEIDIQHVRKVFDESIKLPGQHIVSMLSDKLNHEDYQKYKPHIILELSQSNKFFKI